ncbi:hypothetical protein [Weissella minor]|uniref:Uncharacterized protein n=1 Tax=Weissella minor TaxID=1620 RepID=A0A0R2JS72_9LACO|nr:hypothetical protein [Weissella minor]KRN77466.1 hypothetical protein IV67_GL001519 [Weissella minor]
MKLTAKQARSAYVQGLERFDPIVEEKIKNVMHTQDHITFSYDGEVEEHGCTEYVESHKTDIEELKYEVGTNNDGVTIKW